MVPSAMKVGRVATSVRVALLVSAASPPAIVAMLGRTELISTEVLTPRRTIDHDEIEFARRRAGFPARAYRDVRAARAADRTHRSRE